MIRRVFKGKSPYGLIKYLYGEGRRNEHIDAHLIGSWDDSPAGLEPEFVDDRHDVAPLVRQLEQPVRACGRAPEKWVYHLVFRNDPGDRRLSDAEWNDVCTAAMDATGIAPAGDPAGCRWVAVRHADDHVHLVATLAREDGRVPRVWNDYARLAQVAHDFEDRYGLRSTAGRDDHTAARRPGVKEQITYERARRRSPRSVLRGRVKAAAASSSGFGEFTDRLAALGVTVWPRMSERTPDQVTGYAVSLNDWLNAAGDPVRFGGGKLAPDLSLPKLQARWDPDSGRSSPAGQRGPSRGADSSSRGAVAGEDAARVWAEAEQIVREAAEKIIADPDAAADAAWAAGDTLASAAAGIEGVGGGPLTEAADAFDRAGREVYRRTPARSDTGTALRSAGRMIALLAQGTGHPAAKVAALATQLAALTSAVADLRAAQQRLHQAEAARESSEHLRRVAPLPTAIRPAGTAPTRTAARVADLSAGGAAQFRPGEPGLKKANKSTADPDRSHSWSPRPDEGLGRSPSR